MYYRVFLDTNVVLDYILDRKPFNIESELIFSLHQEEKIIIHISALTLANIAYLVKDYNADPADVVERFLYWVQVIDLKRSHFERNIRSRFKDFEDGLQFYAASEAGNIDVLITRDRTGFKMSDIPVLSPGEFLKQFG